MRKIISRIIVMLPLLLSPWYLLAHKELAHKELAHKELAHKELTHKESEHEKHATATYLANEAVLISVGEHKVLFDPFFHDGYGTYQLVPEKILNAVMSNSAPYNDIDVIFVSHAHADHFAADKMLAYLRKYQNVQLVAPDQAIEELESLAGYAEITSRITSVELEYGDPPISFELGMIKVDAVRIPHSGWPGRAEVSNLLYRVSLPHLKDTLSFMHMGDADANDKHFRPLSAFWALQKTDLAFPPYWFFLSNAGNYILDYRINSKHSIGVHVPKQVPRSLIISEKPYFSTPGEVFTLSDN